MNAKIGLKLNTYNVPTIDLHCDDEHPSIRTCFPGNCSQFQAGGSSKENGVLLRRVSRDGRSPALDCEGLRLRRRHAAAEDGIR